MTLARTPYARLSPADIGQVDRELKKLEQMSAGLYVPKVLVAARSPYTVQGTDTMLLCDCTAGAITLTFPLAARVEGMSVKVVKSDTSANAVTLSGTFSGGVNPKITVPGSSLTATSMNGAYHVTAGVPYPVLTGETGVVNVLYQYGDVRRYGAMGNGATDDTTALQSALTSMHVIGGGVVDLVPGNYKITTALTMYDGVSLEGHGTIVSVLQANGCNALSFTYTTGFGGTAVRHLGINGTNCTTKTAISVPGTLNEADTIYGLVVDRVYVTNFNIAMSCRTVRNLWVKDCWFQNVTSGILLQGQNLVVRIENNQIVYAGGCGAGTNVGILFDSFNYTGGTGIHNPEGVQVICNQVFGFSTSINVSAATYVNLTHNDIESTVYGIEFTTVSNGFNVTHNYIEVDGAAVLAAIIGHGTATVYNSRTVIAHNSMVGTGTSTAIGIQINDSLNTNQYNVRLRDNYIVGMTVYDIAIYHGGDTHVTGNRCNSSGVTNSIFIQAPSGNGPFLVDGNFMLVAPSYDATSLTNGVIQARVNTINGVTTFPPNTSPVVWGTDNSGNQAALITASSSVKGIVAQAWSLQIKSGTSVSTATAIGTISTTFGVMAEVHGSSGGNIFSDFVSYALGAAVVLMSRSVSGAPAVRTYTVVGGVLTLAMASGTYTVSCQELIAAG